MREASGDDRGTSAHSAERLGCLKAQFPSLSRDEVGDLVTLEMRPHIFDGIKLRGVRWEPFRDDLALGGRKEVTHQLAAMNGGPVPDDQEARFEVALQMLDELHDLRAFDAALVQLKVKPLQGDPADDGEALPVKAFMEQRRLSARCPGSHAGRLGAQSALVHEDDEAPLALGVFLASAKSCASKCQWPSRRAPGRGVLAAGRRSPAPRARARHGRHGNAHRRPCGIKALTRGSVQSSVL